MPWSPMLVKMNKGVASRGLGWWRGFTSASLPDAMVYQLPPLLEHCKHTAPTCYTDSGCSLCGTELLSMLIGSYACVESWLCDKELESWVNHSVFHTLLNGTWRNLVGVGKIKGKTRLPSPKTPHRLPGRVEHFSSTSMGRTAHIDMSSLSPGPCPWTMTLQSLSQEGSSFFTLWSRLASDVSWDHLQSSGTLWLAFSFILEPGSLCE